MSSSRLWLTRLVRFVVRFGLFLIIFCPLLGLLGKHRWWMDLLANFRLQYIWASALLALIALILRFRKEALLSVGWCFILLISIGTGRKHTEPSSIETPHSLITYNVHTSNVQKQAVLEMLRQESADLVLLLEVDQPWLDALKPLETIYPHSLQIARLDNFGIALFSRYPFSETKNLRLGESDLPSIEARIELPEGPLQFIGTHPLPPLGFRGSHSRDQQIYALIKHVQKYEPSPVLIAGDFNATPWSHIYHDLIDFGLSDSRGRWLGSATWLKELPWFALPIDHVLGNALIRFHSNIRLPSHSSDHCPVQVQFSLNEL